MANSVISDLVHIFKSGVSAVHPHNLIRRALKYNKFSDHLEIDGEKYDLKNKNLYVVGMGKAVQHMAKEVETIFDSKIKRGIISIPVGSSNVYSKNVNVDYFEGAKNNLPDNQAQSTAQKVKDLITRLGHDDFLLVLISGGGSALLPLPKQPITLEEKSIFIKELANSGADIKELNTVRKWISDLKGGQLAIRAQPAQVVALILSDIVGDPLDLIASGPTVANEDHQFDAVNIIKKYKLLDNTPKAIRNVLENIQNLATFPSDSVKNYIIGSNKQSITAAVNEAKKLNYITAALSNSVIGYVSDVAKEYAQLTKLVCNFLDNKIDIKDLKTQVHAINLPKIDVDFVDQIKVFDSIKDNGICLIFGGETTVKVKGTGKGGRNQQIVLEFSKCLHDLQSEFPYYSIYFLSAGTDGIDGPTDAAGGIGYLELVSDAAKNNIDVEKYIEDNDSYNFFRKFKDGNLHIITGHTNTNVMDIQVIIIKKKK